MDWLKLISENQLEEINQKSFDPLVKGILVFKHSTRCSISSLTVNRLERNWDFLSTLFPTYQLDLLEHPSLSDKIANMYNVKHESPQVLVIRNGKCIYTASHSNINFVDIRDLS